MARGLHLDLASNTSTRRVLMRSTSKTTIWPAALLGFLVLAGIMLPAPVQGQGQSGDDLQDYIERTEEIIRAAADVVLATDSPRARRILQQAQNLHELSKELAMKGHIQRAHTASRRAREAALLAASHARRASGLEERALQRLERYREFRDQILDRAREAGDQRALRFIRESEDQALRSREQYRQGNYAMSVNLIEPAEALLARAARLLFEGGGVERLERELDRTQTLIDRTAERLAAQEDNGGDAAQDLLQSARKTLDRGEEFYRRGEPLRCLHSLRLARRLAGQATEASGASIDPETVAQQLERWDERYEAVAERVAESESRPARDVLAQARHHRERAGNRFDAGKLEPALRQLRAAFDLLNEASELAR